MTSRRVRRSLAAVGFLYLIALLAPVLAPYDPAAQLDLVAGRLLPASLAHPLGTDALSRDLLSRLLFGARLSLSIAALAVVVSVTVGTAIGLAAGLAGGLVDAVAMRTVDAALAIPRVFLLIVVLALWEHGGAAALVLTLAEAGREPGLPISDVSDERDGTVSNLLAEVTNNTGVPRCPTVHIAARDRAARDLADVVAAPADPLNVEGRIEPGETVAYVARIDTLTEQQYREELAARRAH